METNRLKFFATIAETGSLTKASQILGISHSGLSKAISALEDEVKIKLFRPQGRGLEITEEGKWFYTKALEILRVADEISRGKTTEKPSVRIGLSEVILITCASLIAKEFEEPMTMIETDVGEIEGKILSDEIDFGIAFALSPKVELEYLELGEVRFNSFAREDLLQKKTPETLPYVVPVTDFPFNPLGYKLRDGWPKDLPRLPHFSVSGFSVALDLLRAGLGAVYMPDFVVQQENTNSASALKIAKVREHKSAESKRKMYLVKSKAVAESPAMKKLAKVMRRTCCAKS